MASSKNLSMAFLALLLILISANGQTKSKYSKGANVERSSSSSSSSSSKKEVAQKRDAKNPFRMQKFNMFWEKAKTAGHLNDDQKTQLFVELAEHDEGEIELKHSRGAGGDADGELEARLRHSFIDIMKKFDLRNHLTSELKSQYAKSEEKNHFDKRIKEKEKDEAKKLKSRVTAADDDEDKVASLLKEARESRDFDAGEMSELREEMRHFAERREERDLLLRGKEGEEGEEDAERREERDLLLRGNDDWEWEEEEKKEKKKEKKKTRKMDSRGNLDDQTTAELAKNGKLEGFHHPRVRKLWSAATRRSSFTADELKELRQELRHFEAKLLKKETVDEQAAVLRSETMTMDAGGDQLFHEIEGKREEMERGIKKMETYLEGKIAKTNVEL